MSPLFRPKHNTLAQISLFVIAAGALGVPGGLMLYARTPYARGMQDPVEQPLQFDHRHHTRDEGIDCRYCHNTVDKSPAASIPQTQLCLNCHSQIWNKSPLLEPVRESFFQNKPLEWRRVYKVPEFVYFNHSIHVNRGISCVECHGKVNEMDVVTQMKPMSMGFCLDCHRAPEGHVREKADVFNLDSPTIAAAKGIEAGRAFVHDWNINPPVSCSGCHR
jgi:Cytochrome c7 and related cytochrome c